MGTEIEMDMRVYHYSRPKGKLSVPDFLGRIASTCPLLGTDVITENNFKIIEDTALRAIKLALENRDLKDFGHLAVLLTIIQYAKNWERAESSGFWAYICEQLGYKYSESLYAVLTTSVKLACERYCRVFIKDSNGDNSYYSTVLAHAIAPSKSFFALCDFLLRFYKNNLDCSVYYNDPAIAHMVSVLCDRCKGATIEQDEDIRGNVSGIQAGFRALLVQRPVYMRNFLTNVLMKIDGLLSGDELTEKDYVDALVTQWYIGESTEPTVKRSASVHKRTTEIAFSYGKIIISFMLDGDHEPALRIPSIRLTSRDNPTLVVYSRNVDVYRQTIGVYGNDYASTSEETIIPLSDLCDVDLLDMQIKLTIANKPIYSLNPNLRIDALLFHDGKIVANKTVAEGNYVLFAPKSAAISFHGDIEHQRRSYYAQLYDVYLKGEASVYVNSTLLCCSRPPIGSLRLRLPESQAEYVENGISYPIYARSNFSIVVVGQIQSDNLFAITDNGHALIVDASDAESYLISVPSENGCHCYSRRDEKESEFFRNRNRYESAQDNFSQIPGSPIAYWVSGNRFMLFMNNTINDIDPPRFGMSTSDNNRFVRTWNEVGFNKFAVPTITDDKADKSKKWYPYNNGGEFRRWYGNNYDVVNWEDSGSEIKAFGRAAIRNKDFYFQRGITWTAISSAKIAVRAFDYGFLFSSAGFCIFSNNHNNFLLALLNSKVGMYFLKIFSPTMNFNVGDIAKIPVIFEDNEAEVSQLAENCIQYSRYDWDSFEISWDFKLHPLVEYRHSASQVNSPDSLYLKNAYEAWEYQCQLRFNTLKANEEELNRIFIDIYGLQDELTPEVEDKDVTVRKADLGRDIRSFIYYAVGCMFGRYSLDTEGLAYAGGKWDNSKYSNFIPDADNCIPITDEEYFEDDIVGRFVEFVRKVYGSETLEENLEFIASALGNKGDTSRDTIRNYFLNDFFKNHCQIYQKRPIYWLFDSGKQNGFKALVYMHRWNADTTGNVRVEYLHKMQKVYESEIARMQEIIENSANSREVAAAQKRKDKLVKQLKEAKDYDAKIAHLALSRIDIDLDDGVKVNYEKVQTGQDGKMIEILAKI